MHNDDGTILLDIAEKYDIAIHKTGIKANTVINQNITRCPVKKHDAIFQLSHLEKSGGRIRK